MKKLNLFDKFLYTINLVLAVVLFLSYLLRYISPSIIPFFAVLSLLVPFLLIINVFFATFWLIKLKKQFLLSVIILIIGWFFSPPFYKFSGTNTSVEKAIRVMSYNVKSFDFFHKKNDSTSQNGFEFINTLDSDIIAIQEYYQSEKVKLTHPYKYVKINLNSRKFGMAIYSKHKIINAGSLDLKNTSNNIIFSDIVKEKDTIRIYNIHLESLKINPNQENFGQENSEKLIERISKSFEKQAKQIEQFLVHEKQWNGKKIVCGDFNNTSYSWVYNQVLKNKKDAYTESGKGFGKTFNYWFPMRIDFILTDKNADVNEFCSFSEKYSDHYPIEAKVNW